MKTIDVSNSAIWAFADCPGAYYYSRVMNLEKRERAYPPQVGIIIHRYFEKFWTFGLKGNRRRISDVVERHDVARYLTIRQYRPQIYAWGNTEYIAGNDDKAQKWFDLPEFLTRLLDRYFLARGRHDTELYRPLFVEQPVHTTIHKRDGLRVRNHGIVDLVMRNRETGKISLWEHKSVVNKPPAPDVRFRDSQTAIYGFQLAQEHGFEVDEIIWNYLLQRDPDGLLDPDCLFTKKGEPSKAKDIDTNWQVWSVRMRERGLNPNDPQYADIKERLLDRELTRFFYREYREPLVNRRFLIGNYVNWARHIGDLRERWKLGESPLFNFRNSQCSFCSFYILCLTRLRGQHIEEVLQNEYIDRPKPEAERIEKREVV